MSKTIIISASERSLNAKARIEVMGLSTESHVNCTHTTFSLPKYAFI